MLQHVRRVKYRLKLKHTWAWCIDWRSCSKSLILCFFLHWCCGWVNELYAQQVFDTLKSQRSQISATFGRLPSRRDFRVPGRSTFSPRWPSPGKEGELNHHSRSLGGWLYGSTPGKRQSFWLIDIEFSLFSWEETLQLGDASVNLRHLRYCRMISSGKTENGIGTSGTPSPSRVELSRPNHPSYEFLELVPWQPLNPAGSLDKRRLLKWLFHDQHFKIMW